MAIPSSELQKEADRLLQESVKKLGAMCCKHPEIHSLNGDEGEAITELAKTI